MPKHTDISTAILGARPIAFAVAAALALAGCASLEDASADTATGLGIGDSIRTTPEEDLPEAARNCLLPEAMANTIGRVPTSSVHWVTIEETRVPRPALVFRRQA